MPCCSGFWASVLKISVLALALVVPRSAFAQIFSVMSSQIAIDADGVQVGSWADYRISEGGPWLRHRYLLVAKKADSVVIELRVEGETFVRPMVVRTTLARSSVKEIPYAMAFEVKVGNDKPFGYRTAERPIRFSEFLDRSAVSGSESLRVGGRLISATHYHHKKDNETWDYWVSMAAPPLGFVRSIKVLGNRVSVHELVGLGTGGRPEINEAVQYVSDDEFSRRLVLNIKKAALP